MFLSFYVSMRNGESVVLNGNGTFKGKVVLVLTLPQNICPVKNFTTLGPLLFFFLFFFTLLKTSVASLMKGEIVQNCDVFLGWVKKCLKMDVFEE